MEAGHSLIRYLVSTRVKIYILTGRERGVTEGSMLRTICVCYGPLLLKLPVLGLAEVLMLSYAQSHGRQGILYLYLIFSLLVHQRHKAC